MNYLNQGIRLIMLSGIVQCGKYISAAVYMSGSASQSRELFKSGLDYVGPWLDYVSAAALLAGLLLAMAESVISIKNRKDK